MARGRPRRDDPQPLRRPLQAVGDPRLRAGAAAAGAARARRRAAGRSAPHRRAGLRRRAARRGPRAQHRSTTTLIPLRAIYRRALARGEVAINPTARPRAAAVRGRRDRIASPEEAAPLLDAARRRATGALWATALYAGLRRGELMALAGAGRRPGQRRDPGRARLGRRWRARSSRSRAPGGAGADPRRAARPPGRAPAADCGRDGPRVRRRAEPRSTPTRAGERARQGVGEGRARADHPARVPPHLRLADDRRRGEREGALDLHGPRRTSRSRSTATGT